MTGRGYTVWANRFYVPPASQRPKGRGTPIQALGNVRMVTQQGTATAPKVEFLLGPGGQQLQEAVATGGVHFTAKLKAAGQGGTQANPTADISGQTFRYQAQQNQSVLEGGVKVEARLADGSVVNASSQRAILNHATHEARFLGSVNATQRDGATKQQLYSLRNIQELTVNLDTGEMLFTAPEGQQVQAEVTAPSKPQPK